MANTTIPILKDYPIKINTTAIPFGGSMSESYQDIETVNTSEAGTDIVQTERIGKLTLSISIQTFSDWLPTLEGWYLDNSYKTVAIYDFGTAAYKERQMRMRNYKKKLIEHSEKLKKTTGAWEVSFDLIEK
ncbi:MAG: hypothetical protein J5725_00800 [Bacteroidales bacterium]|nr:hypothetical protein [Bacteroidales bacterium]